jgi:hypothetical protein
MEGAILMKERCESALCCATFSSCAWIEATGEIIEVLNELTAKLYALPETLINGLLGDVYNMLDEDWVESSGLLNTNYPGMIPSFADKNPEYFTPDGAISVVRVTPYVLVGFLRGGYLDAREGILRFVLSITGRPETIVVGECFAWLLDRIIRNTNAFDPGGLVDALVDAAGTWTGFLSDAPYCDWLDVARRLCGFDFFAELAAVRNRLLGKLMFVRAQLSEGYPLSADAFMDTLKVSAQEGIPVEDLLAISVYFFCRYHNAPGRGVNLLSQWAKPEESSLLSCMFGALHGKTGIHQLILSSLAWKNSEDAADLLLVRKIMYSMFK